MALLLAHSIRDVYLETSSIQETTYKQTLDFSNRFLLRGWNVHESRVNWTLGIYRVREKHAVWVEEFVNGSDCVNNTKSTLCSAV